MPRVRLHTASSAPAAVRPFWAKGDPGPIPASLANAPDLMAVALPFVGRALGPSTIGARTKEIVILRTSAIQKCRYCTQTHTVAALDAGLSKPEVQALRFESEARDVFTAPAERALIAWTDAVAVGSSDVGERVAADLRQHFDPSAIVELTVTACATVMLNRYATSLDLPTSESHLARLTAAGLR